MKKLSTHEYVAALEKMKSNPKDRVGIVGGLATSVLGIVAGAGVAGPLATGMGAATIFGSSTLGGILGGVFVAKTPAGWVFGAAVVGGALGYGAIKMIRSGTKSDVIKDGHIEELESLIAERQAAVVTNKDLETERVAVIDRLQILIGTGEISQEKSTKLLAAMQEGTIHPSAILVSLEAR